MTNSGTSKLAQVIVERISSQTQQPDALELGTIQADMSLLIDRFAISIPAGEYLIAEWTAKLILPAFSLIGPGEYPVDDQGIPQGSTTWFAQTRWDWKPKDIDQVKIEVKPDLKAGDRVLVAWVNNGTDPVVISKVVSS